MKASPGFKATITDYLEAKASEDTLFAVTFAKEVKNIDDCITYILNTVQKSGQMGFDDDEIFGMAIHYYDEDGIDIGAKNTNAKVVVNHHVELSKTEKDEAHKIALDRQIAQEQQRLAKKPVKKVQPTNNQPSLF